MRIDTLYEENGYKKISPHPGGNSRPKYSHPSNSLLENFPPENGHPQNFHLEYSHHFTIFFLDLLITSLSYEEATVCENKQYI